MSAWKLECGHVAFVKTDIIEGESVACPVGDGMQNVVENMSVVQTPQQQNGKPPDRSYGCSWGCGNPYDYILISVVDSTTEMLCLVCMLKLMQDMIMAVLNPDDPAVMAAMADRKALDTAPMTSGRVRRRGKNAPADIDDDDLIEAFDSRLTEDELPDDFKAEN